MAGDVERAGVIDERPAGHERLIFRTPLPVSAEDAFAWHARAGAFQRLMAPFEPLRVAHHDGHIRDGARVDLRVPVGPFSVPFQLEHRGYQAGSAFEDHQLRGPFAGYRHQHRFVGATAQPDQAVCELVDVIDYRMPLGWLGRLGRFVVEGKLKRAFAWRAHLLAADLALHHRYRARPRLRVAVTGANGLLGRGLTAMLETGGHEVVRLVRRPARHAGEAPWSPAEGLLEPTQLGRLDAVVHLAGENLLGRWTQKKKDAIRQSRALGTERLAQSLCRLPDPPRVFVCASAVGYYGEAGEAELHEDAPSGTGFLAEVSRAWEGATEVAAQAGMRVVNARLGVILDPQGGALKLMLLPFRAGVGGRLGSGRQWMSWVSRDDAASALLTCLHEEGLSGAVNVCAPHPVQNRQLTRALGRALRRPTLFPVPAAMLRLFAGELADEMLLTSTRCLPTRLQSVDFRFRHPTLDETLARVLGRR